MRPKRMVWNLDDLVSLNDFDKKLSQLDSELTRYDEFYAKMNPEMSIEDFRLFIKFDDAFDRNYSKLSVRAELMESLDQTSQEAKLLSGKIDNFSIKYNDATRKIKFWLHGKEVDGKPLLDDATAKKLFASVPDLTYVLSYDRETARFLLSEKEESIDEKKDITGIDVLIDLRDLIETKMSFFFKPKGKKKGKTIKNGEEVAKYVHSPNPNEREASYKSRFESYKRLIDEYFMIYQARVKDWNIMGKVRGYPSAISQKNISNQIPDAAVDVLIETCRNNKELFQRYFKWKAGQLKLDKLRRFDIYAPLDGTKTNIPFEKGLSLVLDTFKEFSEGFADRAKQISDAAHIDSHPRINKVGGAYCTSCSPDVIPYVLLNYTNTQYDVLVVAHELGHGVHFSYASNHMAGSQHAAVPLCETASTFGEMVVFERLFEQGNDSLKKSLLSSKMDDSYMTIMRQAYFTLFEKQAHNALMEGITEKELSDIYFSTLEEQFGDSVELDPMFRHEWAFIPHFVNTPFYCYGYSFGELLSLSLYQEYKNQGKAFIPRIEKILEYGGSKAPQEILAQVGIDIISKDFWQGGFNILKKYMDTLEKF